MLDSVCKTDPLSRGKQSACQIKSYNGLPGQYVCDFVYNSIERLRLVNECAKGYSPGDLIDLYFLNQLGLVIRYGPINIISQAHPGNLQPLYWEENTNHPGMAIAVYAGIELMPDYSNRNGSDESEKLKKFFRETSQFSDDIAPFNTGHIQIADGSKVTVNFDISEYCSGTDGKALLEKKQDIYDNAIAAGISPAAALRLVILHYKELSEIDEWVNDVNFSRVDKVDLGRKIQAFDTHQPLRHQIWDAMSIEDPLIRNEKLMKFYQRCHGLTKQAEHVPIQRWTQRVNDNGIPVWVRHYDHPLALYHPWTAEPEDNVTKLPKRNSVCKLP